MKKRVKNLTSEIHELVEQVPPDLFSSDDDMQNHVRALIGWCVKYRLPSLQDVWDANLQMAFCTLDNTQPLKGLTHFLLKAFAAKCTPRTERTFYVDDSEVKMKDQARLDVFLKLSGTNGLIDTTVTREHPLILTMLDTIVEGGRYTCSSIGKGSVLAELKDSVKNHQGFVDKMANNFERAADELLDEALEEKHPGGVVSLQPKKFKTPTGSLADGIYLLHSEKKVYLLEAKYTGDAQYSKAKAQLDGFEGCMKQLPAFAGYAFVRVLAHQGISKETEKMADIDGIKLFEQKPCSFREAAWL